ncbi:MAG TPA: TrmH family RNA methyltransferase [Pirellulaceae bacterium]|nr:TrmH family RNA methyltransferase [Pirellulaceae bacterium]HMO90599.1 TrmH family RNA methyltransferase [Pirellulaceae bacterium]HMP67822.1 TrmH family RNA methyltransferase [Pirellulaceae bacterium]
MSGSNKFEHLRHKPPTKLARDRELVIACMPMRSNVNLSRIVRAAGCFGITSLVIAERCRLDPEITRDAIEVVNIKQIRSLAPALHEYARLGYRLVGLEQTTNSQSIYEYSFVRPSVLVVGNERLGITDDILAILHDVVEIPVYGRPLSFNAATSAVVAMYEYCRQFPAG